MRLDKRLLVVVALSLALTIMTVHTALATGVLTSFVKVAGVPVSNDYSVVTTSVPPNSKVLNVYQSGHESIRFVRVKVVETNAVVDVNGMITGFTVTINVKAPSMAPIKVSVTVTLSDGSQVTSEKTVSVSPGQTSVTLNLPNPINPDDVTSIDVTASPT